MLKLLDDTRMRIQNARWRLGNNLIQIGRFIRGGDMTEVDWYGQGYFDALMDQANLQQERDYSDDNI